MTALDKLKKELNSLKPHLAEKFKVKALGIFGSFVRNQQKSQSDIDILVEFSEPVGFFEFLELEEYLEKTLKRKVDLVTRNALKPAIGRHILEELIAV